MVTGEDDATNLAGLGGSSEAIVDYEDTVERNHGLGLLGPHSTRTLSGRCVSTQRERKNNCTRRD